MINPLNLRANYFQKTQTCFFSYIYVYVCCKYVGLCLPLAPANLTLGEDLAQIKHWGFAVMYSKLLQIHFRTTWRLALISGEYVMLPMA